MSKDGDGDIQKLMAKGFADIKSDFKDFKKEMKNIRDNSTEVKNTADDNTQKIGTNAKDITALQDQMKELIESDQDLRRREGRRYL